MPKNIGEALVTTYSMLDGFLDDKEVKTLNKLSELLKDKNKTIDISKERISEYFDKARKALRSGELFR